MRSARRDNLQEKGKLPIGDLPSFVAAAHELKSPLALVRQLALSLESLDLCDAQRVEIINQIKHTSERSLRLTNDLTKTARLDGALFTLEPINPQQLCHDIAYELSPLFHAHGRTIVVKNRRRAPLAVANRDLLRRIITCFGDNALHYSAPDSHVELHTTELSSDGLVRIGVRDYGPAVSRNQASRLGKSFNRINMTSERPQSSGLGLYIARQFAEVMNGSIGVVRHGDGATFYIDIHTSKQLQLL